MIPGSDRKHPTLPQSFHYALGGFIFAVKSERNIKIMLGIMVLAVIASVALGVSLEGACVVLVCCAMVISGELINTAIEAVVDLASPEWDDLAGRAKDVAAAAVWWLSFMAAVAGVLVFGARIVELLH